RIAHTVLPRGLHGFAVVVVNLGRGLPLIFFNDTATTEISTLPLHDALPISKGAELPRLSATPWIASLTWPAGMNRDRKSTRLNSSHLGISYAVFCFTQI